MIAYAFAYRLTLSCQKTFIYLALSVNDHRISTYPVACLKPHDLPKYNVFDLYLCNNAVPERVCLRRSHNRELVDSSLGSYLLK